MFANSFLALDGNGGLSDALTGSLHLQVCGNTRGNLYCASEAEKSRWLIAKAKCVLS